jgi:hypothetical protein
MVAVPVVLRKYTSRSTYECAAYQINTASKLIDVQEAPLDKPKPPAFSFRPSWQRHERQGALSTLACIFQSVGASVITAGIKVDPNAL